ncbi:MAG TPA: class I SAM-dependent methyltransferase, partial [Thiothrix sp.]|nr:class I SAM-dependent methyltransferase [Thiothrix sp.]
MMKLFKRINKTVEFYLPDLGYDVNAYIRASNKQGIHHVGRYQWATSLVTGKKRILDIACGAGYGAMMYSKQNNTAEIIGADYDERAVHYANKNFSAANLSYKVGNLETWQWADGKPMGKFDLISSFDTIEHLHHREIAMIKLCDALTDDGMLLLSTPCGHR